MPPRSYQNGQALSEYAMIGALLLVVAIGALIYLGATLKDTFSSMLTARPKLETSALPAPGAVPPSTASSSPEEKPPASSGIPENAPYTKTLYLQLADGTVISLSGLVTDTKVSVETVGANGTLVHLANTLIALADELEKTGELSSADANQLRQLANMGHKVADVEKTVENALAAGKAKEPITYDGKTYSDVPNLALTIGLNICSGDTSCKAPPGSPMDQFMQLSDQVVQKFGNTNEWGLNKLVFALSRDIISVGDQVENATHAVQQGEAIPSDQFNDNVASKLTNGQSGKICNAGGNSDVGAHCD